MRRGGKENRKAGERSGWVFLGSIPRERTRSSASMSWRWYVTPARTAEAPTMMAGRTRRLRSIAMAKHNGQTGGCTESKHSTETQEHDSTSV